MSLLTKEQQETFESAKDKLSAVLKAGDALNIGAAVEWLSECNALLSIIDDLQARVPKQYTEQELRMEFRKRYSIRPGYEKSAFAPWIECAAFVGALKAEP